MFLRWQVKWPSIPISLEFSIVCFDPQGQRLWHSQKVEGDDFMEVSCFFNDPAGVGNLISGSSAFAKSSLNIWKFMVPCAVEVWLGEF